MSNARDFAARVPVDGALSNRNMVINGAMTVAQRSSSATGVTAAGYYACDRFAYNLSGRDEAVVTVSQASDAPDGFTKSFKIETTTAETAVDATEYFMARYKIEAQDLQHLKYGTSSAQQLTLSFWVKSSIAATYAVYLYSPDGSRIIGSTYTIDTASTWEYKTITFAGDTGGTINDDNGSGLDLAFILAAGSDRVTTDNTSWGSYAVGKLAYGHTTAANAVITTLNATWQITGVQLEVGDTATPFEHRSYGDELARCQRYYKRFETTGAEFQAFSAGVQYISTIYLGTMNYHPEMRAAPSFSTNRFNNNDLVIVGGNNTYQISAVSITGNGQSSRLNCTSSGMTQGDGAYIQLKGGYVDFDAEL